ncbi:DUF4197 domain-containing protein [Cryomorphaceae bacterium 1068]|nr:DUF4197 domain-containing protein [Cryomorphaceae bacterium 1068]
MKKIILPLIAISLVFSSCSEESFRKTMKTVTESLETSEGLSSSEVAAGLKEALVVGTNNAVDFAGKENQFLSTPRIRIPFPEEAEKVKETAEKLGLGSQVDKFEENLNHAAEKAVSHAAPIFIDAITSMTINDAFAILKGEDDAATTYLRRSTETSLRTAFEPEVNKAINEVELTKYWQPLVSTYNTASAFTGGEKVNPDLEAYVTDKAMDGLFLLISEEEEKIREDPAARVTELLEKVFGSQSR